MPVPIVALQRGLSIVGQIRMGEKTEKGAPKRLSTWRLTSAREDLIREAAGLYGGEPKPWQSPVGDEWEVVTTTAELPVLLIPGYGLTQTYELWSGPTKCERRCDGEEELQTGQPCLCNAEGVDSCDLYTRLTVALPELPTMLGWRLRTQGANAAREIAGGMQLVETLASGRAFVPGRVRITERRGNVNGQATRYVVPIIDLDPGFARALTAASIDQDALPDGYRPLRALPSGVTLEQGLAAAETKQPAARNARSAAPIPAADDLGFEGAVPVPGEPESASTASDEKPLTAAQVKKLNVLVGTLRDAGRIRTEQLYGALAKVRNIPADDMIVVLEGRDDKGVLHWSPLRDSLTRAEASNLIDRLEKIEPAGAAA